MRELLIATTAGLLVGALVIAPVWIKIEAKNKPCELFVKENWPVRNLPVRCLGEIIKDAS